MSLDSVLPLLACPRDGRPLVRAGHTVTCADGHAYPVIDDVPILLRDDVAHTHWEADLSLDMGATGAAPLEEHRIGEDGIDTFVRAKIGATGGIMYRDLTEKLPAYPVPRIRLEPGNGRTLLDIGCNWGRWTMAAARQGYRAIGIDPSIHAVRAAMRVCRQLGLQADFVVGDARYLPFATDALEAVFSYSVIQHFAKSDAALALAEAGRVLAPGGVALIQMPNTYGVRCLYHQVRRRFRDPVKFEVRYWRPRELREAFERHIGPASLSVDGFFALNAQPEEQHLLPLRYRLVVRASDLLRRASRHCPWLIPAADSLYVTARR